MDDPIVKSPGVVYAFYTFIVAVCVAFALAHFFAPKPKRGKPGIVRQSPPEHALSEQAGKSQATEVMPPPTTPAPQATTTDPFHSGALEEATTPDAKPAQLEKRPRRARFAEDDEAVLEKKPVNKPGSKSALLSHSTSSL